MAFKGMPRGMSKEARMVKKAGLAPELTSELTSSSSGDDELPAAPEKRQARGFDLASVQCPSVSPKKRAASAGEDSVNNTPRRKITGEQRIGRQHERRKCSQPLLGSGNGSESSSSEEDPSDDGDYGCSPTVQKKKQGGVKAKVGKDAGRAGRRSAAAKKREKEAFSFMQQAESPGLDEESIRQSQENNRAVIEEMERHLSMSASSQAASSGSEVPRQASRLKTCPFCHEDMPLKLSAELVDIMQYWLDRFHQKHRLGATATLEACQRHRNEAKTIPDGRKKGWMKTLDEEKLGMRVRNEKNSFMEVMRKRVLEPSSSDWFNAIIQARQKYGKQAESSGAQMQNLNEMQAGYFGERGWEVLRKTLVDELIDHAAPDYNLLLKERQPEQPLQRLGAQTFIERVLLPELICLLIIKDEKARRPHEDNISMEEAKRIRDESADYGTAMFPSDAIGNVKARMGAKKHSVFGSDDEDDVVGVGTKAVGANRSGIAGLGGRTGGKEREGKMGARRGGAKVRSPPRVVSSSQPLARPRPRPRPSASSRIPFEYGGDSSDPVDLTSPVKQPGKLNCSLTRSASPDPVASPSSLDSSVRSSLEHATGQGRDKDSMRQWRMSGSFSIE